jgi:hypothetical protein
VIDQCLRAGYLGEDRLALSVDDDLVEKFENADGSRPRGVAGVIVSEISW